MKHNQTQAVLLGLLGFGLTSAVMLPPILADQAERAARIAAHEAAIGEDAVIFGAERQARLAHLLRHVDAAGKKEAPARR